MLHVCSCGLIKEMYITPDLSITSYTLMSSRHMKLLWFDVTHCSKV